MKSLGGERLLTRSKEVDARTADVVSENEIFG